MGILVAGAGALVYLGTYTTNDVEDIRLIHPPVNSITHAVPGELLLLKGESAKRCRAYQSGLIFGDAADQFRLYYQLPAQIFGERLEWVDFRCPDKSSARIARTVVPAKVEDANSLPRNVEVVDVSINLNRIDSWLQEELKFHIQNALEDDLVFDGKDSMGNDCERLPESDDKDYSSTFDPKCAIKVSNARRYYRILDIELTEFEFATSEGFVFDVSADALLWERKIECSRGCKGGQKFEATIDWKLRVDPVTPETWHQHMPFKLTISTEKFNLSIKKKFWKYMTAKLFENSMSTAFEEELESRAEAQVKRIFAWLLEQEFAELNFQFVDQTMDGNINLSLILLDNRIELSRINVELHGGKLTLSLSATNDWLETLTPLNPNLVNDHEDTDISVKISYGFVNKILIEILEDKNLDELLEELGKIAQNFGKLDEFDDVVQQKINYLGNLNIVDWFDGIEFDESLKFELPLRFRPVSAQESRVFFAQAEAFSTNSWLNFGSDDVPLGLSMEGEFVLGRIPREEHVDFLLGHIAIEPLLPIDQSRANSVKSIYQLSPAVRRILGQVLKSAILPKSDESYLPVEFEMFTSGAEFDSRATVLSIGLLENDIDQNALIVKGQIVHSRP